MKRLFLISALIFLLIDCKKSNDSTTDSQPPVVSLTSPTNMQSFTGGTVPIKATITDNDTLASLHLNFEGPDFIHHAYAGSGKTQNLIEDIPVPIKGKYTVTLEAFDKSGNHSQAKVDITVN